jgi:8-oxo-dGTP pyrophosphatase MutT (NUDIX family)
VLLAIVESAEGFWIPFVERPQTMPQHPGQIGLPGGGQEDGESVEACALREAEEEIGLLPERVEVLGRLSPVTIGVSRFRVEVLVGGVRGPLDLAPRNREVNRLLRGDPELWQSGPSAEYVRERQNQTFRAPAYAIDDALIWGATALMLAEFLWIWNECGPEVSIRNRN